MNYYFPIHLDGGNRGCEAIAKGSATLIGEQTDRLFGYCRDTALDTRLGLPAYMTLVPCKRDSMFADRALGAVNRLLHTPTTASWRQLYPYRSLLRLISEDDVVVFTGGDMMCYEDNELIYLNNWLHRRHIKTILWGCSMGPENQTKEKLKTLRNFTFIYTRESMTYAYFQSLGLTSLCLLPDPAFILPAETWALPDYFNDHQLMGLNISNYVMGGMTLDSKFAQEVLRLISYILDKTGYHILLTPHVTWNDGVVNQDDRQMARMLKAHFGDSKRLHILDIDSLNYCQIRYAIAQCCMFIGARTHAVISAYAMCVPAIALGYSIKSRGIAQDLGLDKLLVVNSKEFVDGDLLHAFQYLDEHQDTVRSHLRDIMPDYRLRAYQIRDYLTKLQHNG